MSNDLKNAALEAANKPTETQENTEPTNAKVSYGEYIKNEPVQETAMTTPSNSPVKALDLSKLDGNDPNVTNTIQNNEKEKAVGEYRKSLIMQGFSPEEADTAARKWVERQEQVHSANNPSEDEPKKPEPGAVVEIRVNKEDAHKLEFTDEERAKLVNAKVIKLQHVSCEDLLNIKIDSSYTNDNKASYIKKIESSLATYDVPLPMLGDLVTFGGAQTIQLHQTMYRKGQRLEERINSQMSLIYNKLVSSNVIQITNDRGKTIMTYDDFIHIFPYADIPMALYAILCASTIDDGETTLTCGSCSKKWVQKYSVRDLLIQEPDSDDIFNKIAPKILENGNSSIRAKELHKDNLSTNAFKSPITGNIYEIGYPSAGQMIEIFSKINQEDEVIMYNMSAVLFIKRLYIYNKKSESYIKIEASEIETLIDTALSLPEEDIKLISKEAGNHYVYSNKFEIPFKCEHCSNSGVLPVSVDNLLLLKAQQAIETNIE